MFEGKSWSVIEGRLARLLRLEEDDLCFYYLVHTSDGFEASRANSLIANFKRDIEKFGNRPNVMYYKNKAIDELSEAVGRFLRSPSMRNVFFSLSPAFLVPIPVSEPKSHRYYDNRLDVLCDKAARGVEGLESKHVFDFDQRMQASHAGGSRNVDVLEASMIFDGFDATPALVILVDDVITTGAHFAACKRKIKKRYPSTLVIGMFLSIHRSNSIDYSNTSIDG